MNITRRDFDAYRDVQDSGLTNMWDVRTVSSMSGLSKDKIMYIMKNYENLMDKYDADPDKYTGTTEKMNKLLGG